MKSKEHFLPGWVNDIALVAIIVIAAILPATFYYSINRGEVIDPEKISFNNNYSLGNVDVCQVRDKHILIRGWALIPDKNINSPTEVYIEAENGNLVNIRSRVIPRPDVDEHFNISYRNSANGFTASSGIISEKISLPTRVVLAKKTTLGELQGAYYDCQG